MITNFQCMIKIVIDWFFDEKGNEIIYLCDKNK